MQGTALNCIIAVAETNLEGNAPVPQEEYDMHVRLALQLRDAFILNNGKLLRSGRMINLIAPTIKMEAKQNRCTVP